MRFDLFTLYCLAIGTLLLSAALTVWERQAGTRRREELRLLATGYVTLAAGCALATGRHQLPGVLGPALSSLVMMAGYLLILNGVASFDGRRHRTASAAMLLVLALGWVSAGVRWQDSMWSFISALPIAAVSGMTAWEMLRNRSLKGLRSRHIVVAVTATHMIFYAGRAFLLPFAAALFGPEIVSVAARITMYEGVLYSVALPMGLLALIREETQEQLLKASRTDDLTGIGNRRWFFEEGERLLRASSAARPITLLAFDLDHFKAINDRYGHATGDEVLTRFARIAQQTAGPDTLLARIGGEEFVALLPGRGRGQAREIGQAVANRFAEAAVYGPDSIDVVTTVSVGLSELGPDGTTLGALLSSADRALYMAKARGRNRIEVARPVALAAVS